MSHLFDDTMDDAWRHERFIVTIQQRTGIGWDKAERAAQATLETLAERVSAGVARDLAGDLPVAERRWLRPQGDAQPFDPVTFVRRVAEREQTDPATAEAHVRAVFLALARLLTEHELGELVAELSKDYGALLDPTMEAAALPFDEVVDRVQGRGGLDRHGAERALAAVLETLAERIGGREADDLAAVLPPELGSPLRRGRDRTGGKAQKMPLDEFLQRIADREGVAPEDVLDHVQAVFKTIREIVPEKAWSHLLGQLPRDWPDALALVPAPRHH
jgi:uncharacterized protein (DUF2267 family)